MELNGHFFRLAIIAIARAWRSGLVHRQLHEFSSYAAGFDNQSAEAHRQFESPRTRAAWVEIEHSVARLSFGDVTVSAYYNRESGGFGLDV
jgi:hypothetical protein